MLQSKPQPKAPYIFSTILEMDVEKVRKLQLKNIWFWMLSFGYSCYRIRWNMKEG